MTKRTEQLSPSQMQIRVQILLYKWLEGRPEYYDLSETERAKCNRGFDFEGRLEDGGDVRGEWFYYRTSHREESLVNWLDIEMKISKLSPVHRKELYYYLKPKRGVNVAHWEPVPSDLQIALVNVMLPLLISETD